MTGETPTVAFAIYDGGAWIYSSGTRSCSVSGITYNGLGQATAYDANCTINAAPVSTKVSGATYNTLGQLKTFAEKRTYPLSTCVYDIAVSGITYNLSGNVVDFSVNVSGSGSTHPITIVNSPASGGTATCVPNPVPNGNASICTATPNSGYAFAGFSGDCSGLTCTLSSVTAAKSITATFMPIAAPTVMAATSRKTHAAAGAFDLALSSVTTNPGTEPRQGPAHLLVFTFDKAVTGGTAAVSEGTATVGTPTFSGNEMRVPLTGVTNQQYVTVAVSNVTAADGGTGGSGSIRVGFLAGDVNQSRVVTLADLGQVNAQVAQAVTAANYLKDVNASGTLSLADKGLTNQQLTKALPAP